MTETYKTLTAREKRNLLAKGWTAEEIKHFEINLNPVLWCQTYLNDPENPGKPFRFRSYQADMIRCKAQKKAARIGRRAGKSIVICAECLWRAFTTPNLRVLICTPFKNQTQGLWKDGFQKLIKGNEYVESSINRMGQNPHMIEFSNGSRIMGLTAGSRTGNKGSSIRGANADILVLDEVDYMGEEAIQAILAIGTTNKNTRIIASSTPTGRREFFYNICTNKSLGYVEFHYPSSDSPHWISIEEAKLKNIPMHESQEFVYRNLYPEEAYNREFLAIFGEETLGVFKHKYMDASLVSYDPKKEVSDPKGRMWFCGDAQKPENVYALGVDWNGEKIGTQLVLTEYCKVPTPTKILSQDDKGTYLVDVVFHKKYRVFYKESISVEDMTQLTSIRKIIDLNNKFKIDHIYVDSGFGQTNIEELKLYGMKNRESNILEKLKAIDFASEIVVYDPYTKEELKKAIKPFAISNASVCLEKMELILPEAEDEQVRLVGQMRAYRVEKISPTGIPRYSSENEHSLIAFILSLLAFQMEYSELIKQQLTSHVTMTSKPSMLVPGSDKVTDRDFASTKLDKVAEYGIPKRQPKLFADKYHSDSRGTYMDYEELTKTKPIGGGPFQHHIYRTGFLRGTPPSRSNF